METTYVYIADLAVSQNEGLLVTIGLGSCVGLPFTMPSARCRPGPYLVK